MQNNVLGPLIHTTYKVNSKHSNNLNIRVKTIKFLGEHIEVNIYNLGLWNGVLDITSNSWASKEKKTDKLNLIKIKNFFNIKGYF